MTTAVTTQQDNEALIDVLLNSLYPNASRDSALMVISYCQHAGYDVMQKPVHIVPMWDAGAGRMRDVIMPGMSGTQLAAELRQRRPELPVLFMSGYTSGPAPGGQELPPDAPLIHKPFQTDQLLHALHQLLDRRSG